MMKCIAIDDEPLALRLLEDNISRVPFLQLAASCSNALQAIEVLQQQVVDLIFVDIQMPGLTGFELIRSLTNRPLIIFVTAYPQYALESYDMAVVDYLVKPVPLDKFIRACNRANELHELQTLKQKTTTPPGNEYFFVPADYSHLKVMIDDIRWIEGLRDYVKMHLKSTTKPLVVRTSLKAIEQELPPQRFLRIHKSWLVAVTEITSIRKNSLLLGELELPIGETYKESVDKLVKREW